MFSEKLRRLRKEKGYTQRSFAECLGIASSTMGMYEQGRRMPDEDMLYHIGELLGISVEYLLSEEQEEILEEDDLEEIISEIKTRLLERKAFSA